MTESFLHYVWQHQMLDRGLTTTDGQPVVVLHAGEQNHDAGPDFFNARLRIGDMEWAGNVEIHIKTSDWNTHRHQHDAAYNNIVLHVVYEHDTEIRLQNGKVPPTLELKRWIHPSLMANYESLMAPVAANAIPCGDRVGEVPGFLLDSFLERLAVERIEAKSEVVRRLLAESHGGWEQTCYWLVARYFGGKVNALSFELLAKATDQRLLARWSDDRQRLEALLMGQAGLLEGYFEDSYPRALQADYEALRAGAGLTPMDDYLWKFYCLRPSSFPTIRISQLAGLLSQTKNLFATLLAMTDVKDLERFFRCQAASYWNTHYQFDQAVAKSSTKHIGRMQADTLIINAWVPLLFVYGVEHGQQRYKDQALELLSQLAAENNVVMRCWQMAGVTPANAAQSQALLQLTNNYCTHRRCLECRIGYQLLKHQ
ncbi:MAG: DUF2851 family protein [Bacteroidales bacterium]|nr:DUF2851 family protein [Bacteroidales bacterium]